MTSNCPKRIWMINQYASDLDMAKRQIKFGQVLASHGYDVTVICGSFVHRSGNDLLGGKEKTKIIYVDGVKFLVVKSKKYEGNGIGRILATLKFQKSVMKLAKKMEKPDIVISDFVGLFGNKFLKLKTKYGAQFISDVLDLWPETFVDLGYIKRNGLIAKILYKMEHKGYSKADYCIFSFEGGKDYIAEKGWDLESGGDIDLSKVKYINNGIDLAECIEDRNNFVYVDEDLDSKNFKAVYLGTLSEANNPQLLLDAAIELSKINDNCVLLVYGDGTQKKQLESQCKELGLTNIKFKGKLDIKYAPNVLSRGDVNIFNFANIGLLRFGCSPNKLFMYLASGKPILSTVRPNYDIVSGRGCGIVVDNNAQSLAQGIVDFSNLSQEEYNFYKDNCDMVAKEFDYGYMIENVLLPILKV